MDMWAWVHDLHNKLNQQGDTRLANLLYQIPNDYYEDVYHRLEAALPEAIMGAKALKHPWMEIFFRHFDTLHRINFYLEGEKALPEMVSLIEFSSRDENRNCPQSICAVRELSGCYANIDGPGWVEERLALVEETLERISPDMNCFYCFQIEKADILADDGKEEEALLLIQNLIKTKHEKGIKPHVANLITEINFLGLSRQYHIALEKISWLEENRSDEINEQEKRRINLEKATIFSKLGQFEQIDALLPDVTALKPFEYERWLNIQYLMIINYDESRNTPDLAVVINQFTYYFENMGAHRTVVNIALIQFELGLRRKSKWMASYAIELIEKTLPNLKKQDDVILTLDKFKTQFVQAQFDNALIWFNTMDEFAKFIDTNQDLEPELFLDPMIDLNERFPNNPTVVSHLAEALNICHLSAKSITLLEDCIDNSPTEEENLERLIDLLIDSYKKSNDLSKLSALKNKIEKRFPSIAGAISCIICLSKEDYEGLIVAAQRGFEVSNGADLFFKRYEKIAYERLNRFDDLLAVGMLLIEHTDEENLFYEQINLLTYAAAAQNWDVYKHICGLLDLELFDTDNPDNVAGESDGNYILVMFEENGESIRYLAIRTGAVLARVVSIAPSHLTQHVKDWVVIEPYRLEEPPEDPELSEKFIPTFPVKYIIKPGEFKTLSIIGPKPTQEQLEMLEEQISALGWVYWQLYDDNEFDLPLPDLAEPIKGFATTIAVPIETPDSIVFNQLKSLTAEFEYPFCWLGRPEEEDIQALINFLKNEL